MAPTLEIISKDTPGATDKIGRKELGLLLGMLQELDHPVLARSTQAYGYLGNGQWNEAQLFHYKTGIPAANPDGSMTSLPPGVIPLKARMEQQGYTFFLLRDEKNNLIGLASGNAAPDKSQLRVLNIAVSPEYQGQGYAGELVKQLSHYAAENQFKTMVMPMSEHALKKGHQALYEKVAEILELRYDIAPHPQDPRSIEFRVSPKKFKTLDLQRAVHTPPPSCNCL